MQHNEGTFPGAGGLKLYYQSWHPPDQPHGVLVIVHGLGGHSSLFGNVVQHLVPCGYAIYGLDLRGHGRSPGQQGYINSWAEFREDVGAFLRLVEKQEPGCPHFLLGHSLGGAITLDYVLHYPSKELQGVIVLAPALGQVGISPFKLALGYILSQVCPRFTLDTGIDLTTGSRDPAVLTAYTQDPLRHTRGSARLATEFLATVTWIQTHAADLELPLLILHGDADQVALPSGSCTFFQRVTFLDKELKLYPGVYHEIHNDFNYQEMLADLEDWLERHLERSNK